MSDINIYDKRTNSDSVEIQKLYDGTTFEFENDLYILINKTDDDASYRCYAFQDNDIEYFFGDEKVTPVDVDLFITRNIPASEYIKKG